MLSGQVARKYTHAGLPDETIHIQFSGIAGQSFGAFLAHGITLDLVGDANDYVGKGLSGGRIIVRSPNDFRGFGPDHIIAGNTVLYGAIQGEAYFNGVAGERFAVRNSGAAAVVEGTGDHCCEYMTGGTVVVLGNTGRNFAAGMSGGVAYVYDPDGSFEKRCNTAMVALEPVLPGVDQQATIDRAIWHSVEPGRGVETDEAILRRLIESHFRYTGSFRAREILASWPAMRGRFVKVFPQEYRRALGELAAARAKAEAVRSAATRSDAVDEARGPAAPAVPAAATGGSGVARGGWPARRREACRRPVGEEIERRGWRLGQGAGRAAALTARPRAGRAEVAVERLQRKD